MILLISSVCVGVISARYMSVDETRYFTLDVEANYYVRFDPDGGEIASPTVAGGSWSNVSTASVTKKVEVGNSYGELAVPVREGYRFAGWSSSKSSRGIPVGYQEVEYIEFHGMEYIDTGYIPNNRTSIDMTYELNMNPNETAGIFGARETSNSKSFILFLSGAWGMGQDIGDYTKTRLCTGVASLSPPYTRRLNGEAVAWNRIAINDIIGVKIISHLENGKSIIQIGDDTLTGDARYSSEFVSPGPAYIGAINTDGWEKFRGKVYSCCIKDNGNTVRDFVPCMDKKTGEYGLFDLVENKFYGDATGGKTFSGGTEVRYIYPDTEVTTRSDHTAYAIWKPLLTVTFDVNGGKEMEIKEKTVAYQDCYGELPTPERDGYDFAGWLTTKLPGEYQAVSYLESYGREYIDLGFVPNQNSSLDMVYELDEDDKPGSSAIGIFGARQSSDAKSFTVLAASAYGFAQDIYNYKETRCCTGTLDASVAANIRKLNGVTIANGTTAISKVYSEIITSHLENGNSYILVGNDKVEVSSKYTSAFTCPGNAYLFTINGTMGTAGWTNYSGKIYSLKLYDGGNLIRNLVPCYEKKSGEYGMYDMVDGTFYRNVSGTGAFGGGEECGFVDKDTIVDNPNNHTLYAIWNAKEINVIFDPNGGEISSPSEAGGAWADVSTASATKKVLMDHEYGEFAEAERTGCTFVGWGNALLPAGFDEVEYLICDGKQFINSNVYGNEKTEACVTADATKDDSDHNRLLGDFSNGNAAITINLQNTSRFGNQETGNSKYYASGKHIWKCNRDGIWKDETKLHTYSDMISFTMTKPILVCASHDGNVDSEWNGLIGKIYGAYISNDGEYVRNYIPAVWSGGETKYSVNGKTETGNVDADTAGLYDLVTRVFYINCGTGAFTAGSGTEFVPTVHTVSEADIMDNPENNTLYAVWNRNKYRVTLDYRDEDGTTPVRGKTTDEIIVDYGSTYYLLPEVSRSGYRFNGWYDESELKRYCPEDTVAITDTLKLHAVWEVAEYEISFDGNGAEDFDPGTMTVTYGKAYGELASLPEPHRAGYSFEGWARIDIPDGYKRLEYIECSAVQYINTGYFGNENTEIGAVSELTKTDSKHSRLLGDYTNSNKAITINLEQTSRFGNKSSDTRFYVSGKHLWYCNCNGMWRDDTKILDYSNVGHFVTERELWVGATSADNGIYGYLYDAYIKEGDNDIRRYVPAQWCGGTTAYSKDGKVTTGNLAEGTVGLYDQVNQLFYINSGKDAFAAGTMVVPEDGKMIHDDDIVDYEANHVLYAIWKPAVAMKLNMNYEGGGIQIVESK